MEHHGFVVRGGREMENHYECLLDLFRSIPSLEQPDTSVLDEIYWLEKKGINLHIIDMNVPTKNMMVKIFFTMMSVFAELEANLLSERTKKGLEAARARGQKMEDLHYLTTRKE